MKGKPQVVKQESKLRPRLRAARPVTDCSFSGAQTPLDSTQLTGSTAHRPPAPQTPPTLLRRFHRKCATESFLPQRELGNGFCGPLSPKAKNSTLAGNRSPPAGNASWTMESSKDVSPCACAAGGDNVQLRRGSVAKHPGCCSLLAVRSLGAFPSHRFLETVTGKGVSSCLPGCPAAPVAERRRRGGKGWREATA